MTQINTDLTKMAARQPRSRSIQSERGEMAPVELLAAGVAQPRDPLTKLLLNLLRQRVPSGGHSVASRRKPSGSAGFWRSGFARTAFIAAFLFCIGIMLNGIGFQITPRVSGNALGSRQAGNQQFHARMESDQATSISTPPVIDAQLVDAMQTLREKLVQVTHSTQEEMTAEHLQLPTVETMVAPDVPPHKRSLDRADDVKEIQKQLASLGYFAGPVVGVWGPRSREALRAFKEANSLPATTRWDEDTEAVLFSGNAKEANFTGNWAVDVESCSSFPVILQKSGAKAGDTSCVFGKPKLAMGAWDIS